MLCSASLSIPLHILPWQEMFVKRFHWRTIILVISFVSLLHQTAFHTSTLILRHIWLYKKILLSVARVRSASELRQGTVFTVFYLVYYEEKCWACVYFNLPYFTRWVMCVYNQYSQLWLYFTFIYKLFNILNLSYRCLKSALHYSDNNVSVTESWTVWNLVFVTVHCVTQHIRLL